MDEVYKGHRIAIRLIDGELVARITQASGREVPVTVKRPQADGPTACMAAAREALSSYLNYMNGSRLP